MQNTHAHIRFSFLENAKKKYTVYKVNSHVAIDSYLQLQEVAIMSSSKSILWSPSK